MRWKSGSIDQALDCQTDHLVNAGERVSPRVCLLIIVGASLSLWAIVVAMIGVV